MAAGRLPLASQPAVEQLRARGGRPAAGTVLRHVCIWLALLLVLAPLAWAVMISLSDGRAVMRDSVWPGVWTLAAYTSVVRRTAGLLPNLWNSVEVTLVSVGITSVAAVLGGYALAYLRLWGRASVVALLVASLFIPTKIVTVIAVWDIQRALGLINVTWGLILPYSTLALALGVLIMRAIFQGISPEVIEAARMDGAGPLRTLWSVLLPMATTGVVLVATVAFVAIWGEYLLGAMLMNDRENRTLPVVLAVGGGFARPGSAAFWIASILPSVLVAALAQRWILRGIQEGMHR